MNKLYLSLSAIVILAAAFSAHSFAQARSQSETPQQQQGRTLAINVVRTVNTAEAGYLFNADKGTTTPRHRYATWPELYASGILDEMRQSTPEVSSLMSADGVRGYNLALIVSPDGRSYQFALHDANSQSAGFSVFTDQSGLIYTGSPLQ